MLYRLPLPVCNVICLLYDTQVLQRLQTVLSQSDGTAVDEQHYFTHISPYPDGKPELTCEEGLCMPYNVLILGTCIPYNVFVLIGVGLIFLILVLAS